MPPSGPDGLVVNHDVHGTEPYYIRAPESFADDRNLVLKQGHTFVVVDRYGDIRPVGLAEEGLYHRGTRHLSRLFVRLGGHRALLLSSSVRRDNTLIAVDLTNPDIGEDEIAIPRGVLHLSRTIVLWDGVMHEQLRVRNYGGTHVASSLDVIFDADYADIFEVRGTERLRRGERLLPTVDDASVVLAYRGLDNVTRRTRLSIRPWPGTVASNNVRIDLVLAPGAEETFEIMFACETAGARPKRVDQRAAVTASADALAARRAACCGIETSNTQFNEWLSRSLADLSMMITDTASGPFPDAGVPWFSTPFGRDSVITALECLWAMPALGRGVLHYLAATQATATDAGRDAQPGKILHESRDGEMAALGEVPFDRYYGSHDVTPLFLMLASAYYERTGDRATIERLWPHLEAALTWIERHGDADGDGFCEYFRHSPDGLLQQGWKDSHDSVFHRDGRSATGPIALCEIQAYVYAAWRGMSRLARLTGRTALAGTLNVRAEALRAKFDDAFWCADLGTYAMALDGDKQPCAVVSSNAGHVLFAGIARHERAAPIARALLSPEGFSGWGVRTIGTSEARYNPMSYHNGSVWPHDNAIVASGFARYGLSQHALRLLDGMFEASVAMDLHRLPELFCGFPRRPGENPTLYPVACSPQAWASGAAFLLLQSVLGLEVHATHRTVRFTRGRLPEYLDEVRLHRLAVGPLEVDLRLRRHEHDVSINVMGRTGDVEIVAIK
jgi:glycogen debranching enzyme